MSKELLIPKEPLSLIKSPILEEEISQDLTPILTQALIEECNKEFSWISLCRTPAGFLMALAIFFTIVSFFTSLMSREFDLGELSTVLQYLSWICGGLSVLEIFMEIKKIEAELDELELQLESEQKMNVYKL